MTIKRTIDPADLPGTGRQYYYRPLAYYNGRVLKCAGFGAENPKHRAFYEQWFNTELENGQYLPGVQILDGYHGDRIDAVTHEEYDG